MKFKIAVIDKDQLYLDRLCKIFGEKYSDKLSVYSYTSVESFNIGRKANRFDLALFEERIAKKDELPKDVQIAYLVNENDVEKIDEISAIAKFQKHDIILKQIMDMCLERETMHYTKKNILGNTTKVLFVTATKGGVGATTVACAAAMHYAGLGKKVLYLSLEKNSTSNLYFSSLEDATLSDVIYLLKSKKNNLISRIENIVQKDSCGVEFFKPARTVFDMNELTFGEISTLLKEMCLMGSYEYIIIDSPMGYDETAYYLCEFADDIIVVSDGSVSAAEKTIGLQSAIQIWDSQKDARIQSKVSLLYNRFDSNSGIQPDSIEFNVIGGTPKFANATEKQISEQLANMDFWNGIMK